MNVGSATEVKLQALEAGLEELKHAYELFFSGQARVEPKEQHDDWRRKLLLMNPAEISSTSQKFRFVNLKSRYNTFHVQWSRICQQIEEGTYRRDKFIAKVHEKERGVVSEETPKTAVSKKSSETELLQISSKEKKAIESLHKKLKEASGNSKVPDFSNFSTQMEKQIMHFKEKNPGKSFQFRLAKDAKGKLQIKIATSGGEK